MNVQERMNFVTYGYLWRSFYKMRNGNLEISETKMKAEARMNPCRYRYLKKHGFGKRRFQTLRNEDGS